MRNPFTGHNSPGYRFQFHVRTISHSPLFLPIEMKELPEIIRLLNRESPLVVFNVSSIKDARKAFRKLRYAYDFTFWAANEYHVRHICDPELIVPLILNEYQHIIIDTFLKQYFNKQLGRYIITKDFPKVGLTTCIQAYFLWCQIYRWHNHSCSFTPSELSERQLKANLTRFLKRDIIPGDKSIFLPMVGNSAFYNSYRSPDALRGINFAYVHMSDFSKFHDPDTTNSSRAYVAAISPVQLDYHTLIVLEGNIPKTQDFNLKDNHRLDNPKALPYEFYPLVCRNPFFLRQVAETDDPSRHLLFLHLPLPVPRSQMSEFRCQM